MRRYYDTPEFKALAKEWDQRLAASGFRDLECKDAEGNPTGFLLGMSAGDLGRELYDPSTEEYFTLARAHMHTLRERLRKRRHRRQELGLLPLLVDAWSYHCEGLGPKAIARHLGSSAKTIDRIVKREKAALLAKVNR